MASLPLAGEPDRLLCPISKVMFQDPVFTEAGNTYERAVILELWQRREECFDPLFNTVMCGRHAALLRTNWDKRREVQEFLAERPSYTPHGWETREVPTASPDSKQTSDNSWWSLRLTMCPKRRWMRIVAMVVGSVAGVVGSLAVEFTCLGTTSADELWPCSTLVVVSEKYSPWVVAPVSVIIGGFFFGAVFGGLAAVVVVIYIAVVWVAKLIPEVCGTLLAATQRSLRR